jgi:N-acylneuraminate cytidylyltransferase
LQHGLESIHDEVENVIVLQPTNPLRPPNLLKIALRNSKMKKSIVCLPLLKTIRNLEKLNQDLYSVQLRNRSTQPRSKALYFENGLLYITKAALILENRIISEKAFPYLVNHIFAQVDIDTQEDFDVIFN